MSNSGKAEKKLEVNSDNCDENICISEDDLVFFQNCIVADNLEVVKAKLQETLQARIKYCTSNINVLKTFPIFVFESELVTTFLIY